VLGRFEPVSRRVAETRQMTLGEKVAEVRALMKHGTNQHTNYGHYDGNDLKQQGNSSTYLTTLKRLPRLWRINGDCSPLHLSSTTAGDCSAM